MRDWTADSNLVVEDRNKLLERLFKLDKTNTSGKQLERIQIALARDDCQPSTPTQISKLWSNLSVWPGVIVEHVTERNTNH